MCGKDWFCLGFRLLKVSLLFLGGLGVLFFWKLKRLENLCVGVGGVVGEEFKVFGCVFVGFK